jgi:hypothetical protein
MEPARALEQPTRSRQPARRPDNVPTTAPSVVWLPVTRPVTAADTAAADAAAAGLTDAASTRTMICAQCHHARVDRINSLALCTLRSAESAGLRHASGETACGWFETRHRGLLRLPAFSAGKT